MPGSFLLPLLLVLPLLGAALVLFVPKNEHGLARGVGLGVSLVTAVVSLGMLRFFNPQVGSMQLVFDASWVPLIGARLKLGIDGISVFLVLLTTFLTPLTLLGAWRSIEKRVREFVAAMLVLETGMLGAFLAIDLFAFYIFWEVMLIPMYLLIGIWGGPRRLYASMKFVIYTMVGSLLMLVAIFYLYAQHGAVTGTYTTELSALSMLALPRSAQVWCFAAFALAFAIKVPLFPLHTWLPDAHVEAPTPGSVILAGVLLKFGIYGFLRFAMPLFPFGAATLAPWIAWLSVIGIVYGAFVAYAQDDIKKLVAYSSVSHLGFCALGIFALTPAGIAGSIFAMLSHGLTTGGLFLGIGVLYERRHTRKMAEYGGIWKQMPVFSGLFLIITMGSAGLPALSGFVGEFLTIFGTFIAKETFPQGWPNYLPAPTLLATIAASGVIWGAIYLLTMFIRVFFGPLDLKKNGALPDLSARELAVFIPLVIGVFALGIKPQPILAPMAPTISQFVSQYKQNLSEPDGPPHIYGQAAPQKGTNANADGAAQPTPSAVDAAAAPRPVPTPRDLPEGRGIPLRQPAPVLDEHGHPAGAH